MPTNSRIIGETISRGFLSDGVAATAGLAPTVTDPNMPGQDLIDQAEASISSQIAGKVPDDVLTEVERIRGERSIQGGVGLGEKARNLTIRDFGVSSLAINQQGIENAMTATQIRDAQNKWDDQFMLSAQGMKLEGTKIELMGLQLIAENQRHAMSLANDLIMSNANKKIKGVQGNVNTLIGGGGQSGFLNSTNESILKLLKR
jgi:hypothetical protein